MKDVTTVLAGNARDLWFLGNSVKVHKDGADTGGQFALIETRLKPGSEPPMHVHQHEDETFLVLEGQLKLTVGGEELILHPGESAFAPRQVPHTFQILTPEVHTIGVITPAGFEEFFRALGEPKQDGRGPDPRLIASRERVAEMSARFGVRLV
jgi:quercetin dioxygenase-like cupin family protein